MAKTVWTPEAIKNAIRRYETEFGKLPTARDFDLCPYLPTSRQIQRRFGGLPKLRIELDIEGPSNYARGVTRSNIATLRFSESRVHEEKFYGLLTKYLPEVYVHEQKRLRPGDVSCDFYVYTGTSSGFAIDIFYAQNLFSLQQIINIKVKHYRRISAPIFFVAKIPEVSQEEIDRVMNNKKIPLPSNIRVLTEETFARELPQLIGDTSRV